MSTATKNRPATVGPKEGAAQAVASSDMSAQTIDTRSPMEKLFDQIGLRLGCRYAQVWTVNGHAGNDMAVVGIAMHGDIVITFREMGTSTGESDIPWRAITRLVK